MKTERVLKDTPNCGHTADLLKARQGYSLKGKVFLTEERIREWYERWDGKVYVAFSGGKDSTVLLHLVRRLYPEVPAAFSDTGLEYPEIKTFVRSIDNVTWVRPKMPFWQVIKKYGFPVVSKLVSRQIRALRRPPEANPNARRLYLTGITSSGCSAPSFKLAKKWRRVVDAPFLVSEQCCDVIKKGPLQAHEKKTGLKPFIGTMAKDSKQRLGSYLSFGCNVFDSKHPQSRPMAFWLEEDVWAYIKKYKLSYSEIYDMGEERTGCMFCMFGVQMEKGENRFQRMKKTHPKQYDYCINKLGLGKVLDYLGVPY